MTIRKEITLGTIVQLVLTTVAIIIFLVTLSATVEGFNSDVQNLQKDLKEFRQITVPNTYARKDVIESELNSIRELLTRIEKKL